MGKYDDIIDLPHPVSAKHPRMSLLERAAQFSPFAALSGYEDAIDETARQTQTFMELDEDEKERLDETLQQIRQQLDKHPAVKLTYFEPDERKEGGAYQTMEGNVRKLDEYEKTLVFEDGSRVLLKRLVELELLPESYIGTE